MPVTVTMTVTVTDLEHDRTPVMLADAVHPVLVGTLTQGCYLVDLLFKTAELLVLDCLLTTVPCDTNDT